MWLTLIQIELKELKKQGTKQRKEDDKEGDTKQDYFETFGFL